MFSKITNNLVIFYLFTRNNLYGKTTFAGSASVFIKCVVRHVANHFNVTQSVISRLNHRPNEAGSVRERPRNGDQGQPILEKTDY